MMLNIGLSEKIHFIGIGGASMSSLALFLAQNGYKITGSDNNDTTFLFKKQENIKNFIGHFAKNVENAETVIYTRAISPDNPELVYAKEHGLQILERAELLGRISALFKNSVAVSGTHGKTTTTSLISTVALELGIDPTVMVGGKMQCCDSNFALGKSDYFIYEACEYYDAFLNFHPFAAVILNIELDHPDYFKSYSQLESSFEKFSNGIQDGGFTAVNYSDKGVKALVDAGRIKNPVLFGFHSSCDVYAENTRIKDLGSDFTLCFKDGRKFNVSLSVGGEHNVLNALAAFAVFDKLGFNIPDVINAVKSFISPKRRYELVFKKDDLTVIDDFAHHPTELTATLNTAKNGKYDTTVIIFQPHTYTRTAALLDGFAESLKAADRVILVPIYAAREKDIYNVSSQSIADLVPGAVCANDFKEAADLALSYKKGKTVILTVGAGDVYKVWEYLK